MLAGCGAPEQRGQETMQRIDITQGERWRMQCIGGDGAMSVPIFAEVTGYSNRDGRADLVVTDRDGIDGTSVAFIRGNTVTMDDKTGRWGPDGRSASFDVDICPGGMRIERLIS